MNNRKDTFTYSGDDVLDIMERYAPRRQKSIEKLIRNQLELDSFSIEKPGHVLEFGAGKGEFINRLIGNQNLIRYAIELDDAYRNQLSQQHNCFREITEIGDEQMDAIFLIDVLEHLSDDQFFLNQFFKKLKKGGKIFIYVPARMELFSAFDTKIGHYRRYHKQELRKKVEAAGFEIKLLRYHELLGYFAAFFNTLFATKNDGDLNIPAVKIYDTYLVPSTNFLEKYISPPIGKSLYLTAQK